MSSAFHSGDEALVDAVRRSDRSAAEAWLEAGASVASRDEDGYPCFHLAATLGDCGLIGTLLEARADIDATCPHGYSALDVAVREPGAFSRLGTAKFLLEQKASLGIDGKNDDPTPLHYAARCGLRQLVEHLLNELQPERSGEAGQLPSAIVKQLLDGHTPTPLRLALQWMHHEVALVLLDRRALSSNEMTCGTTPLHIAAAIGSEDLVRLLLTRRKGSLSVDAGAFKEQGQGGTALHVAVLAGGEAVVANLLEARADPDVSGRADGLTALDLAIRGKRLDIAEMLLAAGAKANTGSCCSLPTGDALSRPLMVASTFADLESTEFLLPRRALADLETQGDVRPLHAAAGSGAASVTELLLRSGGRPNVPSDPDALAGRSPLHIAARAGAPEVVASLLRGRAFLQMQDSDGCTPLHVAALYNHMEVAGVLMQHLANLQIRCVRGHSPLQVAIKHSHSELAQLLIKADSERCLPPHWQSPY